MSRFESQVSRNTGTNDRDGTRARDTENRDMSRPVFRPVLPPEVVPFSANEAAKAKVALTAEVATKWEQAFIRGVLAYAEKRGGVTAKQAAGLVKVLAAIASRGASCTLCGATGHRASQCKWGQQ